MSVLRFFTQRHRETSRMRYRPEPILFEVWYDGGWHEWRLDFGDDGTSHVRPAA